jgi:glyoxylase-like metal-dependent hydrolase (beta-lactamase superfamily II)
MSESYEIFAVRYATKPDRVRRENFIVTDAHETPMPIDFYVWVIRNEERTIVVDTGFEHKEAERRGRHITRLPREGLAMLGVDAAKVKDVVISHLHFDHAGTMDHFPEARFHIQDSELNYATSRHMCEHTFRHAYTAEHVKHLIDCLYQGRVAFHDGDEEIAPGVVVHHIGGHTMGIQCVSVMSQRGRVVLAVDTAHFYENMEKPSPFPIVFSVADMLKGFHKMRGIAESPQHIVPGHDPLVLKRYPAPSKALEGIVCRLDVAPSE